MSTCNKKVQPITSRIITDKDGNKTYESTNPDKIGLLFLNYNEPFCLSYVKDKKKYDPYKLIENFGWGKDEEKCISQTSNDTYVLNQSTMNSMCQQINKVITETTTSVCNNSTTSISQYNEVKLKDIKCCVDNAPLNCKCNFMISQANKAVLEVNNTFVTNLTNQIKSSVKSELVSQLTNNIDTEVLNKLIGNVDFTKNEDLFAKIASVIPKNKTTDIQNYVNSKTSTENVIQNNIECITESVVNTDTFNSIINNSVNSVKQKNKIIIMDSSFSGKDNTVLLDQYNTSSLLSQTLIENGLSNAAITDIVGNTSNLAEASSKTSTSSDISSSTIADISDSLFGSTPTWIIAVIVVAVVVIVCVIVLGIGGNVAKVVIPIVIVAIIVMAVLVIYYDQMNKKEKKEEEAKKEEQKKKLESDKKTLEDKLTEYNNQQKEITDKINNLKNEQLEKKDDETRQKEIEEELKKLNEEQDQIGKDIEKTKEDIKKIDEQLYPEIKTDTETETKSNFDNIEPYNIETFESYSNYNDLFNN